MSRSRYDLADSVEIEFETSGTHSHFFGYYDKSPFDRSGDRLLSHRVPFDGRSVEADDRAEVGYWDLGAEEFVRIGETGAFNWQQGSMLQWLPPDYERRVVYNDRGEDGFRSVVVDIETGEETVLPSPIYEIHPSAECALAVNFERLVFCRAGYSYRGVTNQKWDTPVHEEDGIFRVDLETGESERIVATSEICEVDPRPEFEEQDSWLEHAMWNPSGTRFAFFHRWADGRGRFRTRLFTAASDGSDLFMFPDTGLYSHMDWRNDREFTVWGIKPSTYQKTERFVRDNVFLNSIVRPAYGFLRDHVVGSRMNDVLPNRAFIQFLDRSGEFELLAPDRLDRDGHLTWTRDERWLLTDTYPDEEGYQHLLLYDDDRDELHELGRFYSRTANEPYKCDLHPRWDRDEDRIVVDSAHRERRQMMVLDQDVT